MKIKIIIFYLTLISTIAYGNFALPISLGNNVGDLKDAFLINPLTEVEDFNLNKNIDSLTKKSLSTIIVQKLSTSSCTIVPTASINGSNMSCNGVCDGKAYVTAAGAPPFTYNWIGTTSNSSIASGLCAGNYSCVTTNSCGLSVTNTIQVTEPPPLFLNPVNSNTSVCVGNTSTLSVSPNAGTGATFNYSWSNGSSTSSIVVTPTVTPITTYTVNVTDPKGCLTSKIFSIAVRPNPNISITPINSIICAGKTVTINLNGASTYTTSPGNIILSSFTVNPTSTTTYTVIGASPEGCIGYVTKTYTIVNPPNILSNVSSPTICVGSVLTFSNSGGSTYTLIPSSLSGSIINFTPTLSGTTIYTIAGTSVQGCINTKTISITSFSLPTLSAYASSTLACIGQTVNLTATGNAINYLWQPINLTGINQTVIIIPPASYTVYGEGSNGCKSFYPISININSVIYATPVSTPSIVCSGSSVVLSVIDGTVALWGNNTVPNTNIVSPIANTIYTATAIDKSGCSAVLSFTVKVDSDCSLIIYNGFSPNGDGINDSWQIKNIELFPKNKVYISNRWGNKIYETTNYNNTINFWDGMFNGVKVPNGTYFYVIELNDGSNPLKGWIEVTN